MTPTCERSFKEERVDCVIPAQPSFLQPLLQGAGHAHEARPVEPILLEVGRHSHPLAWGMRCVPPLPLWVQQTQQTLLNLLNGEPFDFTNVLIVAPEEG